MSSTTDKPFRPMLAYDAPIEHYKTRIANGEQLYASYKLDGIRAMVIEGQLVSRTLKPIPNHYTRGMFGRSEYEGLDGELIVGAPCGEGVFARTSSGVMSHCGDPDVRFYVFDTIRAPQGIFHDRLNWVKALVAGWPNLGVELVQQSLIGSDIGLDCFEADAVRNGYEGLIIKSTDSPYKQGRSTLREGYMGKLKRFQDSEAVITGFEEMMHNDNAATLDARGFTVHTSHQENQRPAGMLGALRVQDVHRPEWCFGVGSGFDHDLRRKIWESRPDYLGKVVKYKYLPVGTLELPRHPVFLGFRPDGA